MKNEKPPKSWTDEQREFFMMGSIVRSFLALNNEFTLEQQGNSTILYDHRNDQGLILDQFIDRKSLYDVLDELKQ